MANPETIEPAAVDRWLIEAEERLRNAETLTKDHAVRDAVRSARKELEPALRRARQILDDERLRHARQQELL